MTQLAEMNPYRWQGAITPYGAENAVAAGEADAPAHYQMLRVTVTASGVLTEDAIRVWYDGSGEGDPVKRTWRERRTVTWSGTRTQTWTRQLLRNRGHTPIPDYSFFATHTKGAVWLTNPPEGVTIIPAEAQLYAFIPQLFISLWPPVGPVFYGNPVPATSAPYGLPVAHEKPDGDPPPFDYAIAGTDAWRWIEVRVSQFVVSGTPPPDSSPTDDLVYCHRSPCVPAIPSYSCTGADVSMGSTMQIMPGVFTYAFSEGYEKPLSTNPSLSTFANALGVAAYNPFDIRGTLSTTARWPAPDPVPTLEEDAGFTWMSDTRKVVAQFTLE